MKEKNIPDEINVDETVNTAFEESNAVLFMMRHYKLLRGIGFALVFLGLVAATAGILGLTAGLLGLSVAITQGLAVVGGAAGISLCAAGGGVTLFAGILAAIGLYGSTKANPAINKQNIKVL